LVAPADLGALPPQLAAVSNARADANLLGLLGLELLLLVFFIVLVGAAKPDADRALPVMQSLRQSFPLAVAPAGDPALAGGDSLGKATVLLEHAAQKLRSELPLGAVSTWVEGRRLFVDLPVGGFFPERARLSPLARERLVHIARLIRDASAGNAFALGIAVPPAMPDAEARLAAAAAVLGAEVPPAGILTAFFGETVPADRIRFQLALGDPAAGDAP
jgi:hypothetical protein